MGIVPYVVLVNLLMTLGETQAGSIYGATLGQKGVLQAGTSCDSSHLILRYHCAGHCSNT